MLIKSIALVILLSMPLTVHLNDIPYNHDSITLFEVIHKVDFPVLAPDNMPNGWTLEIKGYPMDQEEHFTRFRLHYMNEDDTIYKVGIEQRKFSSKKSDPTFSDGEDININGNKGLFIPWGNDGEFDKKGELITGGLLQWTQDGTQIEMDSTRIPKELMLEIARSMKVVELE